jgi:hypothetical protein
MRKYVPLYEDLEIPSEFNDEDMSSSELHSVILDDNMIFKNIKDIYKVTTLSDITWYDIFDEWLKKGARSFGFKRNYDNKIVIKFYDEEVPVKYHENLLDTKSNLVMFRNYFQQHHGSYIIVDTNNTVTFDLIDTYTKKLREGLEVPGDFTDADMSDVSKVASLYLPTSYAISSKDLIDYFKMGLERGGQSVMIDYPKDVPGIEFQFYTDLDNTLIEGNWYKNKKNIHTAIKYFDTHPGMYRATTKRIDNIIIKKV